MWQSPEKEEKKNKSFALTDITFYITAFLKKNELLAQDQLMEEISFS